MVIVPVPKAPAVAARIVAPLTVMALVRPVVPLKTRRPDGVPAPAIIDVSDVPEPVRVTAPDSWVRISKAATLFRLTVALFAPRAVMKLSLPDPPSIRPLNVPPWKVKLSLPAPRLALVIEPVARRVRLSTPEPVAAL